MTDLWLLIVFVIQALPLEGKSIFFLMNCCNGLRLIIPIEFVCLTLSMPVICTKNIWVASHAQQPSRPLAVRGNCVSQLCLLVYGYFTAQQKLRCYDFSISVFNPYKGSSGFLSLHFSVMLWFNISVLACRTSDYRDQQFAFIQTRV